MGSLDGTSLEVPGIMNRDGKARRDEESQRIATIAGRRPVWIVNQLVR